MKLHNISSTILILVVVSYTLFNLFSTNDEKQVSEARPAKTTEVEIVRLKNDIAILRNQLNNLDTLMTQVLQQTSAPISDTNKHAAAMDVSIKETMTKQAVTKNKTIDSHSQNNAIDKNEIKQLVSKILEDMLIKQWQNQIQVAQNDENSITQNDLSQTNGFQKLQENLALDETQSFYLRDLFDQHTLQNQQLHSQTVEDLHANNFDQDQITTYFNDMLTQEQTLNIELEESFIANLTTEQAEIYHKLPADEKGMFKPIQLVSTD